MSTDISKRLSQLRARRTGISSTARETIAKAHPAFESIAEDVAGPESWESRGTDNQQWTKYAIGSMQAVGKKYTEVSVNTANRVADQLRDRLATVGISAEFKIQGSVPLDVHIKRVSDVDLLTIDKSFYTYETDGVKAKNGHYGTPSGQTSESVLAELRRQVESVLPPAFPMAEVDFSGAKAVKVSGGSLARSVDVVPAHWLDTVQYQSSGRIEDRAVRIYDKKKHETIKNRPFLHIHLVGARCDSIQGGLRKAIRLCKNVKADSDHDIKLSSFDITSIMYHADMAALRAGQYTDLAVLAETQRYLDYLWRNESIANELLVPDRSRRIFDMSEKRAWLGMLSREIDLLLTNVYNEISPGQRVPNQTLDAQRTLVRAAAI
ncbi:nucleotidyltransferase family protein [Pseudoduganella aquatica]|uniref:hypothetical protein n=1 Tax=Pseudoduganella aquatica TaxID=2660641 RepID=UPI001E2B225C|nr:hypothetical protein [Pseudoduganella aquatica]